MEELIENVVNSNIVTDKKQLLFELIEKEEIQECTFWGLASSELYKVIEKSGNITNFFENKGIDMTSIKFYKAKMSNLICSIHISKEANLSINLVNKIIDNFFAQLLGIYQFNMLPNHIEQILNNTFNLEDILMYFTDEMQQRNLIRKINIDEQTFIDLKEGKKDIDTETLSTFIQEYPLMPWITCILTENRKKRNVQ